MKILITGSNGYIGNSLLGNLKEYDITTLHRGVVDLLDSSSVDEFFSDQFFDIVIHSASVGGNRLVRDDESVYEQNITMFNNIHNNNEHFNKLISFGSGVEMIKSDPYSLSKRVIRDTIMNTPKYYNIRIFGVFDSNELDRRFIKSNIIRYTNNEKMEIHQNKNMDFFYMGDLIKLVNYFINNDNPPKEVDCSYSDKYSLLDVANIINTLDDHTVPIDITGGNVNDSYVGDGLVLDELPLDLIGLISGIKEMYKNYI